MRVILLQKTLQIAPVPFSHLLLELQLGLEFRHNYVRHEPLNPCLKHLLSENKLIFTLAFTIASPRILSSTYKLFSFPASSQADAQSKAACCQWFPQFEMGNRQGASLCFNWILSLCTLWVENATRSELGQWFINGNCVLLTQTSL